MGFCVYLINPGQCYSSFGKRHEWMSKCKRELLTEKGRVPVCVQIFNTSRAPSSSLCHRSVSVAATASLLEHKSACPLPRLEWEVRS